MPKLITIKSNDQSVLRFEVDDIDGFVSNESAVEELAGIKSDAIGNVELQAEVISTTIVDIASFMIDAFDSIAVVSNERAKNKHSIVLPTDATLEFGISFTASGNIYIVKASGEANLKIIVNWNINPNGKE